MDETRKLKVLIAEDDASLQALYNKGLTDEFFEKRFASDGKEAMDEYATWSPDIIILDIYMPNITGYSLLMKIRKDFEDRTTAIIMATSAQHNEDINDCIKLGIQGYIVKPFKFKKLATEILRCYEKGVNQMMHVKEAIRIN